MHNNYSFKSVPRRVRDLLPEEADRLLKNRFAEINVWRAIRGPIEGSPLALCDARSLFPDDGVRGKHGLQASPVEDAYPGKAENVTPDE